MGTWSYNPTYRDYNGRFSIYKCKASFFICALWDNPSRDCIILWGPSGMVLRRFFWNKSHLEERRNHVNLSTFSGLAHSFFFRSPQKPPRKNHPPFDFFESFEIWTHNLSEGQRLKAPTYSILLHSNHVHTFTLSFCLSLWVSLRGCLNLRMSCGSHWSGLAIRPLGRHPEEFDSKPWWILKKNGSSFPIVSIIYGMFSYICLIFSWQIISG